MEAESTTVFIRNGESKDNHKAALTCKISKATEEYKVVADLTDFPYMIDAEAQAFARGSKKNAEALASAGQSKKKRRRRWRRRKGHSCVLMEFHTQQQPSDGAVTDGEQAPPGEAGKSIVASVVVTEKETDTSQKQADAAECEIVETVVAGENKTELGIDSAEIVHLCASSSVEDGLTLNRCSSVSVGPMASTDYRSSKRRWTLINKQDIIRAEGSADAILKEMQEEKVKVPYKAITSGNVPVENIVLRRLLRRPRYFDPLDSWVSSPNCGEDHIIGTCKGQKQKPCFLCGSHQHSWWHCRQDCFLCKRCDVAGDCQIKEGNNLDAICLRCGATGHDMFSCRNDYCPEDLMEIRCFVCSSFGHLCCAKFQDTVVREISCYNCGQSGHLGFECIKRCGPTWGLKALVNCYRCREEGGHFAPTRNISRKCARRLKRDWSHLISTASAPAKSSVQENEIGTQEEENLNLNDGK